jgi:hypothetical protein
MLAVTLFALAGCPATPTPLQKAQETATAFNVDARFGRMEMAMEHVAPELREEFVTHHRAWGSRVRIADVELAGMHPRDHHNIEVAVRIAWYVVDQDDLRMTTLQQVWNDEKNGWQLVTERRAEGDVGLLGEPVVYDVPDRSGRPAQFPTVRLGGQLGSQPDDQGADPER